MAQLIEMTPESLRSEAKRLMELKATHDDQIKRMGDIIHSTSDIWQGGAQQAYANKFDEMQVDFNKFSEMLQHFSELISSSADEMEQADRESSSHVQTVQHVN